jgi:protein-S-isoprenylcysteine O-methyltransferase Ste14
MDGSSLLFVLMQGFVPLTLYRIGVEEQMLIESFGDEYREYMKKTKKKSHLSIKC